MTPNSELLGDTAWTSQISPLSTVTVAPLLALRWPGRDARHFGENLGRHGDAGMPSARGGRFARAREQDHLALHDGGQVVFDRGVLMRTRSNAA